MDLIGDDYDMALDNDSEIFLNEFELEHSPFRIYAGVASIIIFCISMTGNSFLLWVLLRERAWRTTSDSLLLQLTASNLCFTVPLPFMACNQLYGWIFGEWACGVMHGFLFLGQNSFPSILTAMTLHRYVTLVHASRLPAQCTGKTVVYVVMWLVCAAASTNMSVNSIVDIFDMEICVIQINSVTMHLFILYTDISLFFLIPFLIITFCYVHMWITVTQRRINRLHQPSRVILGIAVGLFVCVAPYYITVFIMSLMHVDFLEHSIWIYYIIDVLFIIHCCLNPLFHIFGAQRFRRHLYISCNTSSERRDEASDNLISVSLTHLHTV